MKQFLFLYPIKEYFDNEIKRVPNNNFRKRYFKILNECTEKRYRRKDFGINWALFDKHEISFEIELEESDKLIYANIDFKTHTTKQPNGKYLYPNNDFILNQLDLNSTEHLVVTGFHIWDCVEKLAKKAHKRKLNVLIDEDLTEFLPGLIRFGPKFRKDIFPSYNPRDFFNGKEDGGKFERWFEARKGKPWFWQDYPQQVL